MLRFRFSFLFIMIVVATNATTPLVTDTIHMPVIDLEATLDSLISKPTAIQDVYKTANELKKSADSIPSADTITAIAVKLVDARTLREEIDMIIRNVPLIKVDTLLSENNFLFLPLVLRKQLFPIDIKKNTYTYNLFFDKKRNTLRDYQFRKFNIEKDMDFLQKMRLDALHHIVLTNPELIAYREDELPSTDDIKSGKIDVNYYEKIKLIDDSKMITKTQRKLVVEKIKIGPWTHKANAYLQFSQNYVSKNWHQGGNDNIAILGTVNGKLNYDNKKNIQWENSAEWRAGFNSVEGDTINRPLNTNDDILRLNSKLGIKAGGSFFYSGSFDFSTPLFDTYKGVNSTTLKAAFMTPIRLNLSAGLDYKYKKLISVMVSPFSYKYIYLNNSLVDSKLFGIPKGESVLSEVGSSFKVQGSYSPTKEITLDSRLNFYTNYTKVELDWEIIGNFQVNRFLSTRIILNPRYDNTVILEGNDKADWQFKELLTFGFSYKLID